MESHEYRTWVLGPFEFGFQNEWLGGDDRTMFLVGAGFGPGGFGVGVGLFGFVAHIGLLGAGGRA